METRNVTIEEYWPAIVKNTAEFGQIAVAENPEFNKLAGCIYQVLNESFVRGATEYGVGRWENILNLTPESSDTLDDRKARILTYLNIKLPYTVRVLRQMLIGLLGEDNFTMSINNDTATLTVAVPLDITEAQLAEVKSLLERVLPRNLVTEMEWADGLPMTYTRLEYIESNGKQRIDTGRLWNAHDEISILYEPTSNPNFNIFGAGAYRMAAAGEGVYFNLPGKYTFGDVKGMVKTSAYYSFNELRVNEYSKAIEIADFESAVNIFVCINADGQYPAKMRLFSFEHKKENGDNLCFVPALDQTGAPCLFDTVTRTTFYNIGTSDFLYPTEAAPAVSVGLDDKFYAKLTPNGVRRLYRVPEGSTMTKDEYAAANGFKELVEPPMPMTGYWQPEWRETETQLILDWVETEAPMEVTENE